MPPSGDTFPLTENIRCTRRQILDEFESDSLLVNEQMDKCLIELDASSANIKDGLQLNEISNLEAMSNFLQGNIGMGILILPCALKYAGLIGGTVGLMCMALLLTYCMQMIVKASQKALKSRPYAGYLDYGDTVEAVLQDAGGRWRIFSSYGKNILNFYLLLNQIGGNAVYALFMANSIRPILIHYFGAAMVFSYRFYLLMILPFSLSICMIRNLKYLSPFSILANVIQFADIGVIFYFLLRDEFKPVSSLPWFGVPSDIPIFLGMALFAFDGVPVILPIENRMKTPKSMLGTCGVLNKSMFIVAALYSTFASLGYLKYGNDIHDTITHNLPVEELGGQLIIGSFSIAIFFSYALHFYVVMDIISPNLLENKWSGKKLRLMNFLTVTTLNVFTFGLAAAFPDLELFVSLLGAVKITVLNLMAPALIDTASNWNDLGTYNWKAIRNAIIFMFGIIVCIVGTLSSAQRMIENFKN
jgi:proton-coupled amino acid transporter